MKYLIFPTFADADARNQAEALTRGCNPANTSRWWAHVDHPDGRAALVVDDLIYVTSEEGEVLEIVSHSKYIGESYSANNETTMLVDSLDSSWFPNEGE